MALRLSTLVHDTRPVSRGVPVGLSPWESQSLRYALKGGENQMQFLLAVGSPFDGMSIYGPFESVDTAVEYAKVHHKTSTWWVVNLKSPCR